MFDWINSRLRSCRLPRVFIRRSCLPSLPEKLRNSWVPSLPGSYPSSSLLQTLPPPSRLPSFSRFSGYRSDLLQSISLWGEEGFSSCLTCPCRRAVPTTPPECHVASVSPRHAMLPSPRTRELGLRISVFFRGHLWVYFRYGPVTRSPSLRWLCQSASSTLLSSADAAQAKGLLTFAPVGLPPILLNMSTFSGRTGTQKFHPAPI